MTQKLIKFEDSLQKELQDPEFAYLYLNEILKEKDLGIFLDALKHVVRSRKGGIAEFAKQTGLSRAALYRTLSAEGNPSAKNLFIFLDATGFEFKFGKKERKKIPKKVAVTH